MKGREALHLGRVQSPAEHAVKSDQDHQAARRQRECKNRPSRTMCFTLEGSVLNHGQKPAQCNRRNAHEIQGIGHSLRDQPRLERTAKLIVEHGESRRHCGTRTRLARAPAPRGPACEEERYGSTCGVSKKAGQEVPLFLGSSYGQRNPRSNSEVLPIIKMFRHTGSTRSRKRRPCSEPLRLLAALAGLPLFWPSGRCSPAVLRIGWFVRNPIRRMSSSVPLTRSTEPKHCTLAVTRGRITSPESGPLDNSPSAQRVRGAGCPRV